MPNRLQMLLLYPVCVVAALVMVVWLPVAILFGSERSIRIMLASDRLANSVFGGSDRETISSRAARGRDEGRRIWCVLCRILDAIQDHHCDRARGV